MLDNPAPAPYLGVRERNPMPPTPCAVCRAPIDWTDPDAVTVTPYGPLCGGCAVLLPPDTP
jgi:hypothetical protein